MSLQIDNTPGHPAVTIRKIAAICTSKLSGMSNEMTTTNLQVLFPVEHDRLGLDLPVLDVDLVATEHDGDVLAHAHQITVPVGHVLVSDTGCHVKHDDGTLALNVISVT